MIPHFTLIEGFKPFVFVIPPTDLRINYGQITNNIDIVDLGEITRVKNRKSIRASFSGFFPNINSNFYSFLNPLPPIACTELLRHWKEEGKVLKLIIPEFLQFLKCKIDDFEVNYNDHTGDCYYRISLVEEREQGESTTLDVATGLLKRVL